jgi:hypothetical protein
MCKLALFYKTYRKCHEPATHFCGTYQRVDWDQNKDFYDPCSNPKKPGGGGYCSQWTEDPMKYGGLLEEDCPYCVKIKEEDKE